MNDSPLLAADDDLVTPLLSSGPTQEEEDESRLSLLIRKAAPTRNSPLALPQHDVPTTTRPAYSSSAVAGPPDPLSPPMSPSLSDEVSIVTIIASTLTLLQIGWVWASYLAASWSDTYLNISVSWQHDHLPHVDDYTDTLLRSIDLAFLFHMTRVTRLYGTLALVAATAVLLPCLGMMVHPLWIWEHYASYYYNYYWQPPDIVIPTVPAGTTLSKSCRWIRPRPVWELVVRLGFVVAHMILLLNLATSFVTLHWTNTVLSIHSQLQGGFVSYTMGMSAALLTLVVLRYARGGVGVARQPRAHESNYTESSSSPIVSPPMSAFRYPWTGGSTYVSLAGPSKLDETEQQAQQEEVPAVSDNNNNIVTTQAPQHPRDIGTCHRLCVWEMALLSVLLLVPTLALPLFRIDYRGLATEFMDDATHVQVYLWKLPWFVWTRGGGAAWMRIACVTVLVSQVVLLPLIVWGLAVAAWLEPGPVCRYQRWVACLAPAVNGIALAVALVAAIPSLGTMAEYLLQQDASGLCQKFQQMAGDKCLEMDGTILSGTWALLCHCVALELFVILTLYFIR